MKKYYLPLWMLFVALIFVNVSADTGEYRFSPESLAPNSLYHNMLETEQAIYMFDPANALLMYLDESDMTWYPLCNRPECMHKVDLARMESDCNAFINSYGLNGIVYWKGRLYYFESPRLTGTEQLSSMNPDGTDHRSELIVETPEGATCILHNGKAFVLMNYLQEHPYEVFVYDLDHPDQEPDLIWEEEEYLFPEFFEDRIYYSIVDGEAERMDMYRMYLDGTEREMTGDDMHFGIRPDVDFAYEYFDGKLIIHDYDTGEELVLWENSGVYEESFYIQFDGQYFYLRSIKGSTLLIINTDGILLEEMTFPDNKEYIMRMEDELAEATEIDDTARIGMKRMMADISANQIVGTTRDYVFATDQYMPTCYIERSEIGSGACEWKPIRVYTDNE